MKTLYYHVNSVVTIVFFYVVLLNTSDLIYYIIHILKLSTNFDYHLAKHIFLWDFLQTNMPRKANYGNVYFVLQRLKQTSQETHFGGPVQKTYPTTLA
jgi:hypothetical protein